MIAAETHPLLGSVYLDTSSINRLLDDPAREAYLATLLRSAYTPVSIINIAEVAATPRTERRNALLRLIRSLNRGMSPFDLPQAILMRAAEGIALRPYRGWDMSCNGPRRTMLAEILSDPATVDEEEVELITTWASGYHTWLKELARTARELFQEDIRRHGSTFPRSVSALIQQLSEDPLAVSVSIRRLLELLERPDLLIGREVSLTVLEPWRYYLVAMAYLFFNRGVRMKGHGRRRHAGALDTVQVVYLCGTNVFVTDDHAHRRMLRFVAAVGYRKVHVWSFDQLKATLIAANQYG